LLSTRRWTTAPRLHPLAGSRDLLSADAIAVDVGALPRALRPIRAAVSTHTGAALVSHKSLMNPLTTTRRIGRQKLMGLFRRQPLVARAGILAPLPRADWSTSQPLVRWLAGAETGA